jgi:ankyrin repeat protein
MFPNPHEALPLPPRPSLDHYKKLAKGLLKAARSGDEAAIGDWLATRQTASRLEEFARRKLADHPNLNKAQFVIARFHGFESWPKFSSHLQALARQSSRVSKFEAAADAIVIGDLATLRRLLREDPQLSLATSTREHRATLLHYVAANGVENYRQKTPPNIVEIADLLLNSGAEIDAAANVYGGGCTALLLAATSVHPERAGVQEALLQELLDHGARLEKSIVFACLANGRPKAAEFLAARGAPLDFVEAAGLGRLDMIQTLFHEERQTEALRFASAYGRNPVVEYLLARGADHASQDRNGQTALHHAVIGGHPDTVKLLLRHNVPLELKNRYGGTVLGQAVWSAAHGGDVEVYIAIFEALVNAGAKIRESHPPVNPPVDSWLAAHGSRADPTLHWYGEEPPASQVLLPASAP